MADVIHIASVDALEELTEGRSDLTDLSTPEFRTVAAGNTRKGLRLERAFWYALGVISARFGRKRSALIAEVMQDANDRQLNATSAVRSFVAQTLLTELEQLEARSGQDSYIALLQHAPVPSFAVDRNKRMLRANGEFSHFLRILFAQVGDAVPRHSVQINLETPVGQIFDMLGKSGASCECVMSVVLDTRVRRVRTRIVAVPPHDPTALVGYIIS